MIGFVDVTLYSRNEAHTLGDLEARRAIESAGTIHLSPGLLSDLRHFLSSHTSEGYLPSDVAPSEVLRRLKAAVASGRIVAVSAPQESREAGWGSSGGSSEPPTYGYRRGKTPSQLFGHTAPERADSFLGSVPRSWEKLPAEDGPAMFRSMPGDVMPDGRIATPLTKGGSMFAGIMMGAAGAVAGEMASDGVNPPAMSFGEDSTPLGDASALEFDSGNAVDQLEDDASVFLTPEEEAQCELEYNLDMVECSAYAAMDKGYWRTCNERAMQRYSNCLRGRFLG
ncbi:hypothetical protein [Caballeronia novacaledonica]|uniref:hypothetical protein n=1 Tax=Caballeronia novacaledonica TaxID=1544861 RepID=UPI001C20C5F5|nr:hypothetical protein [Caballeronia novacaledonica]